MHAFVFLLSGWSPPISIKETAQRLGRFNRNNERKKGTTTKANCQLFNRYRRARQYKQRTQPHPAGGRNTRPGTESSRHDNRSFSRQQQHLAEDDAPPEPIHVSWIELQRSPSASSTLLSQTFLLCFDFFLQNHPRG